MSARASTLNRRLSIRIAVGLLVSTVWGSTALALPFPTGDFTGDGKVDISDAVQALRAAVGLIQATQEQIDRADIGGFGRIDAVDALGILKITIGLISPGPLLPNVETATENQAITSGNAAGTAGMRTLWGVRDSSGGLTVADASSTQIIFERIALSGDNPSAAEMEEVGGILARGASGTKIDASSVIDRRAILLPDMARISTAVDTIDLGSVSYPLYASATTVATKSPGWRAALELALKSATPVLIGSTTDGVSVAITVRGPRLPPDTGIVFRYPRVTVVFDSLRLRVIRLTVDIEGWVEE